MGDAVNRARVAAYQDFADKLLELMREAASQAGRDRQQTRRAHNPKRKANPSATIISTCQELWEHYCARPGKKRLQAVLKHLEAMKGSRSAKVSMERRRCLRAARAEAREMGLKI